MLRKLKTSNHEGNHTFWLLIRFSMYKMGNICKTRQLCRTVDYVRTSYHLTKAIKKLDVYYVITYRSMLRPNRKYCRGVLSEIPYCLRLSAFYIFVGSLYSVKNALLTVIPQVPITGCAFVHVVYILWGKFQSWDTVYTQCIGLLSWDHVKR